MEWNMFFIVFGTTATTLTGIQKNPVVFVKLSWALASKSASMRQWLKDSTRHRRRI